MTSCQFDRWKQVFTSLRQRSFESISVFEALFSCYCRYIIDGKSMAVELSVLPALVWLVLAGVVALVLFITSLFVKSSGGKKKKEKPAATGDRNERVAGQRRRRGADMMRRQMETFEEDEEPESGEIAGDFLWDDSEGGGKVGTKKLRKLEMKAEKRAMRQEMESERDDQKQRQKILEDEANRAEKMRKKQKEKEEEEEKEQKEEQERLEHEEYLKLKESFSVEGEGSGEQDVQEESQSLLQEFIDYIKKTKVVLLEDLAAHFSLRTQDAINRVQVLQEVGRLTGVVDDRGKFIYISQEELEAVAKFIKQRGRISISDLSDSSNSLINLKAALSLQRSKTENQPIEASA